ncbi:hypothetical protein [Bacteroides acidifaciens]|uniref:hypothetical protein n=1 Tax=Bacteroides acidifaciens TaxID=85831 RepID=UPI00158AB3A6|nr:hypothetical protein [Bacteroides acidifaciens]
MDKQQLEQQIDQFINNEMSPAERRDFSQKLETDKNLKQQVKLRMLLIEGELIRAEKEARTAMEASKGGYIRPWITTVACVVFVLVGIGLYVGNSYRYTPQEIYAAYYEVPIIERARGEGLADEIALYNQQIINAYEKQQYKVIAELYQKKNLFDMLDTFPVSTQLYISIAFMEQKKEQEAIPLLLSLIDTQYKEEAEWLLLCCYMKTNDRNKALQMVERIKDNNGIYMQKTTFIEQLLKEKKWF